MTTLSTPRRAGVSEGSPREEKPSCCNLLRQLLLPATRICSGAATDHASANEFTILQASMVLVGHNAAAHISNDSPIQDRARAREPLEIRSASSLSANT